MYQTRIPKLGQVTQQLGPGFEQCTNSAIKLLQAKQLVLTT